MINDRVQRSLKAMADADQGREAPPELEARVVAAFRRSSQMRAWRRGAMWIIGGSAAACVVTGLFVFGGGNRNVPTQTVEIAKPQAAPPIREAVVRPEPPEPPAAPVRKSRPAPAHPREVATPFMALVHGDVLLPYERPQIVRVRVPLSAARAVGLPVREERLNDRVEADFLLGEDGQARAIRFVKLRSDGITQ